MAPFKLLVALNTLLWYRRQRHMALPGSTDSEETIGATITLGGYHGTYDYRGLVSRRVLWAGGSDFGD